MTKSHNLPASNSKGALPVDAREALQWFVNNHGLYIGSTRGIFISEWGEEREATLEKATIDLKSRGFSPLAVTGDALYKQADYLWKESRAHTQFGRPLASKLELELGGSDIVIVDSLEAPENSRHLWYLYCHLLYPRAVSGKPTIITTPLSFQEFVRYGDSCPDPDFAGKGLNWEKLLWLIEASMITLDTFKLCREEALPPMLKAEYYLYTALKERGLDVTPQHVLGDFMLDFALIEKQRKLNIECDTLSMLGGSEIQRQEAKRNLVLLSDDWQVLKFTTSEIIGNKGGCADVVDDVWRSGRKRGQVGRLLTGNTVAPMPDLPVDDEVQLAAITYGGGPAAVAGGAGTGKTTCIVQRVAYLLGQGVNPDSILVLTHGSDTQKALKRAIEQVVEKQAFQRMTITSWHDFGLKVLKENLPAIRRKPPLKVEPSPQKIIARLLAKAKKDIDPAKLELSVDLDEFYIAAVISMYKSHLISPKQAKDEAATYGEEIIAKIYQQLEDQLQKANRIDRDDVVTMTVQVMLDSPEVRVRYQRQYEFVLVDEYQDVTVAQDMLARLLSAPQDNLFVVGDEDETIAEAKNACPELFTEWSLRQPHARCYVLERNWRSHPAIVDHARQLLVGLTRRRMNKEFVSAWGQAPASAIIGPTVANDEHEEANWVANEIQLLVDSGRNYGDIAILYRHHVYATSLEEALNDKGVKYQASNPIVNFVPDEIADMMAFLKLVMDPDGPRARESFERVCQLRAREIDPKLSATIASFAEANNLSYLKAVEIYSEATADGACRELEQLVRIIRTMHQEKLPPAETISLIRRTQRLNDYYRTIKIPPGVNYEPLKKLTQLEEESRGFKTIVDFVKHVTTQQQSANGVADTGVQVLPILDCRGLEFPVVFMVGMAEGIFPAQNTIDMEEERRICYVGFTRAKDLLYLSYPVMFSGAMLQPSHFLVDARLMVAPPPMVPQYAVTEQPMQFQEPPYQEALAMQQPAAQQYEQPVYQQPMQQVYEQPVYQQPAQSVYEQPVYQQPAQPVYEQPAQPVYEQPAQPVYEQPVYQQLVQPVYEQPVQPGYDASVQAIFEQPVQHESAQSQEQYIQEPVQPVYEEPMQMVYQPAQPAQPSLAPEAKPALSQEVDPLVAELLEEAKPEPVLTQPDQTAPVAPPVVPKQARPGRAAAASAEPQSPVPPYKEPREPQGQNLFQIHTAPDQAPQRPSMPALPKSKAASKQAPVEPVAPIEPTEPEKPSTVTDMPKLSPAARKAAGAPIPKMPAEQPVVPAAPAAASNPDEEPEWDFSKAWQLPPEQTQPAPAAQAPGQATAASPLADPLADLIAKHVGQTEPTPVAPSQPEPIQPVTPEPIQPVQPQPIQPTRPEPIQPVQPQPIQPIRPEPVQPIQPAQPFQPAQPTQRQPMQPAAQQQPQEQYVHPSQRQVERVQPQQPAAQPPQEQYVHPSQRPAPQQAPQQPYMQQQPYAAPQQPQHPTQGYQHPAQQQQPSAPGHPAQNPNPMPGYNQPMPQPQQPQHAPYQQMPFVPQQPYPTEHAHVDQGDYTGPICPQCTNRLEAHSRFCGECGYTLPERIPACPTCGAPLEVSAKFCGECGMALNAPPVPGNSAHLTDNLRRMQDLKDQQQGWVSKIFKILEN